jgi:hypothetical protein
MEGVSAGERPTGPVGAWPIALTPTLPHRGRMEGDGLGLGRAVHRGDWRAAIRTEVAPTVSGLRHAYRQTCASVCDNDGCPSDGWRRPRVRRP